MEDKRQVAPGGQTQELPAKGGYSNPPAYSDGTGGSAFPAGGAVVTQPVAMAPLGTHPNAPPGLEYLAQMDRVQIHQVLHIEEVLIGFERNNQYQICNDHNQEFLHVKEDTDCCTRQFCGNIRPFEIFITNMQGQGVIKISRDLRCQGPCCPCCLQEMDIEYPIGVKIATIKEKWSCCIPRYEVVDVNNTLLYTIEGICCWCLPCKEIPFKITRSDGQDAGDITKHWGGCRELFGQVNDFTLTFAPGEQPLNKAILLGSTFLVDFMYFERKNQ